MYTGTLKTAETGEVDLCRFRYWRLPSTMHTLERSQIVRMVATSDNFWQRFNGEVSFGTIYSKGNESTQYTLGANTLYVRQRWNAGANFDSNLSSTSGTNAVTRNSLGLTALHLLPTNSWFIRGGWRSAPEFGTGHHAAEFARWRRGPLSKKY